MSEIRLSWVEDATSVETHDCVAPKVLEAVRTGEKKLRGKIEIVRQVVQTELRQHGDYKRAKQAASELKKQLPAVMWSGRFENRQHPANEKLINHSGLLCADLDDLAAQLTDVREKLQKSRHLWALFLSPSGRGLKAVFRVPADGSTHAASFFAVEKHVRDLTGFEIDQACKDVARLCFLSYDPEIYVNENAVEIEPLPEAKKAARMGPNGTANVSERQRIATELLGQIDWQSDTSGFLQCPGKHLHTTGDAERDCRVVLDGAPTVHCFHNHCRAIIEAINHELRSRVGKAEWAGIAEDQCEKDKSDSGQQQSTPQSAATRLVKLADRFGFFHDPQDRAFVRLQIHDHTEVWPVESTKFRKLLAQMFYKHTGRAINRNALADAVATLAGRACHDAPEEPVFMRVAPLGGNILIDLCDPQWRVIEVRPDGWQILDESPVAFIRTGSMRPLPEPLREGSIDPLWKLLNVAPGQRQLVAGALLNYLHPEGPYFVLNFVGEQGTAKSCAGKIVRMLVDPNKNPMRSPPREERDLIAQAANNWCVSFDNLSMLPPWLSDGLCRLSTGGGHSARQLYTDLEEVSLDVKRPVILNGIEDVATRPDLAERALQIQLERIPDDRRITEKKLWLDFEAVRPTIFAGILNGLVCALRELPNVDVDSLPRMADPALWATAGEPGLGLTQGTFMSAYSQNLHEGAIASVEAHPIGVVIRQFLDQRSELSGEPAQLLQALNEFAPDELRHAKSWPQNARSFSVCLRRLAQALRCAGIEVESGKAKRRYIRLCKGVTFASPASPDGVKNASDANDANFQPSHDKNNPASPELVEEFV